MTGTRRSHYHLWIARQQVDDKVLIGSVGEHAKANDEQTRDAILATGLLSELEFAEDLACLDSEELLAPSSIMWTACGQRSLRSQ